MEGDSGSEDQLLDVTLAAWWEGNGEFVSWSENPAFTVIESGDGSEWGAIWGEDIEFGGQAWIAAVHTAEGTALECWGQNVIKMDTRCVVDSGWETFATHAEAVCA